MFNQSTELFFQFPTESKQRILHRIDVTDTADGAFTARFQEPGITSEPGQNVLIYYELQREFVQQSVQVIAVLEDDPCALFTFQTTGEPVSTESRNCYRARAMFLNIPCQLGDEPNCPMQDISATGLAVVASTSYKIGDNVHVSFQYESFAAEGITCVQSVRELHSGRFRYGLHSIGKDKSDREFRELLARITLAVQRLQLKRRSGTG